jgi:hypothetical protein
MPLYRIPSHMASRRTHALYAISWCARQDDRNETPYIQERVRSEIVRFWTRYWGASDTAIQNSKSRRNNKLNATEFLRHGWNWQLLHSHNPEHLARHKHKRGTKYCLWDAFSSPDCTVRSESRCALMKGFGSDVHEPQWVKTELNNYTLYR